MKYERIFNEELSRTYTDLNFKSDYKNIAQIHDFLILNSKVIFQLFKKLERYTSLDIERGTFTSKEIDLFNSIPVPEKHNLQKELPVEIFRGVTLSKSFGEQLIKKIKTKKGKLTYTPQDSNYSSWTTDKKIAEGFSKGVFSSDFEVIFKANLTSKNKAIDIVTFHLITLEVSNYLKQPHIVDTWTDKQEALYNIIKNTDRMDEKEILVFGKIICNGIE